MELHFRHSGRRELIGIEAGTAGFSFTRDGGPGRVVSVVDSDADSLLLDVADLRYRVRYWREGSVLYLHLRGKILKVALEDPDEEVLSAAGESNPVLRAPMPGKILEVLTAEGEAVVSGEPLIRMEAMKMEIDVAAPFDGTVATVAVAVGDLVEPDAELLRLDPVADGS